MTHLFFLSLSTPLDPLHGDGYNFWSGIGSGSPLLAVFGAWWHHHNCNHHRCPSFKTYPHGHMKLCRKHHPDHKGRIGQAQIDEVTHAIHRDRYASLMRTTQANASRKRKVGQR